MDERQRRVRRNQALFRTVNEQHEDLDETFAVENDGVEIVCECGNGGCVEQIPIPSSEYSRIRSDPTLHILMPGHEDETVEGIVDDARSYLVVRKYPTESVT